MYIAIQWLLPSQTQETMLEQFHLPVKTIVHTSYTVFPQIQPGLKLNPG